MATLSQVSEAQQPDLSIRKFFAKLKDPRRAHRRLHRLQDIIVIALCAVIAGAQDWQQIATFGRKRRAWLSGFLELLNGIPSHDTFERVFNRLKPQAFQACFRDWVQAISAALRIKHVAIDGKALRGSGSATLGPLHLVSAWATAQHLSLGQVAVDDKSNEITAIPALLELLDLNGALATIGMCYSERTVKGETTTEVRYFIGDTKGGAKYYADGLRHHWGIENNLHWQLDVNFHEDGNRVQKRNAAENLALLRRLALSLLKAHPSKDSIAKKRFAAALDPSFLEEVLRGDGILEKR